MEKEVIADIARRVKKTGRFTETAEIMAKSMVEQGYSAAQIRASVMKVLRADSALQREIAENTKEYKAYVQTLIDETFKEAKENGVDLASIAENMAYNNDLSMWDQAGVDLSKPNTLTQLKEAFVKQTAGELRNLTQTTGFKNTAFGMTGVMDMYQKEMDHALIKVASGAFSYDQVVNDCVQRLAQSGLRSIDYASGRSYQLDTATRMSVRTGLSQLSGKITEENIKKTGVDLVITSQHMGSRPEHAEWQNKVFSYNGKNKKYPDFFKATGYGTAGGLKGVNCTHDFFPFWEGISIIPEDIKEPDPVVINGKEYTYYQATQKQRSMERSIRATKREIEAQKAIGGITDDLKAKLRKQTMEYKHFSAAANLRGKENRLRVAVGTSDLGKTKSAKRTTSVKAAKEKISQNQNNIKMLSKQKKTEEQKFIFGNHDEIAAAKTKYNELQAEIEKLLQENNLLSQKYKLNNSLRTMFEKQDIDLGKLPQVVADEELSVVRSWTRNGYLRINDYLRTGIKFDKKAMEDSEVLTEIINRNTLKEDIILKRGTDFNALNHLFGTDLWKEDEFFAIGKIITDEGFLATTPIQTGGFGGIQMYIETPKGTKGVYIGDLSAAPNEKEFLLQRGTRLEVIDLLKVKDDVGDETFELYVRIVLDE